MDFKKYVAKLVAENPHIVPQHGVPMNRRELLAQGYLSTASLAIAPSVVSMLAAGRPDLALAADCPAPAFGGNTIFGVLDLAGGANINLGMPTDAEEGLVDENGLQFHGVGPEASPRKADFKVPGVNYPFASKATDMWRGWQSVAAANPTLFAEMANATSMLCFAASTENDTRNNQMNMIPALVKLLGEGQYASHAGTDPSLSGGNSMSPADMASFASTATEIRSGAQLASLGKVSSILANPELAAKYAGWLRRLSESQLQGFKNLSAEKQLEILERVYGKAQEQLACVDPALTDIAQAPAAYTQVFQNQVNSIGQAQNANNLRDSTHSILLYGALRGFFKAFTMSMGGYDYHQNSIDPADANSVVGRDFNVGATLGRWALATYAAGSVGIFSVISDGSCGCSETNGNNQRDARGVRFAPTGDNRDSSKTVLFIVDGRNKTAPQLSRYHIGGFNKDDGKVLTSFDFSRNPPLAAWLVFANILGLRHEPGKVAEVLEKEFGFRNDNLFKLGDNPFHWIATRPIAGA